MALVLTSGERHEAIAFQALMQAGKENVSDVVAPKAVLGISWETKPTVAR
jgi:hypothetical protein